jgi:nucleoside diphosphate kinase
VSGIYYFEDVDSLQWNDAKIKVPFIEAKIKSSKLYVKFNPKHTSMGEILDKYSSQYDIEVIHMSDLESNLQNEEENGIIIIIDK